MKKLLAVASAALYLASSVAFAKDKPNILIIFPDDVGWQNVGAYGLGTMGYKTPNIDKLAHEGAMFADHYAQPSCTAGRAALIAKQYPIRGHDNCWQTRRKLGLKANLIPLLRFLKSKVTLQVNLVKNHLGDRNEHLPTVHGFDEFFGNISLKYARRIRAT